MARVYAIASAKGGVGKTTTTANLGTVLAMAGHEVVVIDGDLGMPNLAGALGVDPDGATLHDVLNDDVDIMSAIYEGPAGLDVVPGSNALEAFARTDAKGLEAAVDQLDDYDVVIVDTGAGLSNDTFVPLKFADDVVLVTTTEREALGDTEKTRQLAERIGASIVGAVLTRVDESNPNAEVVASILDAGVVAVVPEDPAIRDALDSQVPVVLRTPDSISAAGYRALAEALTGEPVPVPDGTGAATDDDHATETTTQDVQESESTQVVTTDSSSAPDTERPEADPEAESTPSSDDGRTTSEPESMDVSESEPATSSDSPPETESTPVASEDTVDTAEPTTEDPLAPDADADEFEAADTTDEFEAADTTDATESHAQETSDADTDDSTEVHTAEDSPAEAGESSMPTAEETGDSTPEPDPTDAPEDPLAADVGEDPLAAESTEDPLAGDAVDEDPLAGEAVDEDPLAADATDSESLVEASKAAADEVLNKKKRDAEPEPASESELGTELEPEPTMEPESTTEPTPERQSTPAEQSSRPDQPTDDSASTTDSSDTPEPIVEDDIIVAPVEEEHVEDEDPTDTDSQVPFAAGSDGTSAVRDESPPTEPQTPPTETQGRPTEPQTPPTETQDPTATPQDQSRPSEPSEQSGEPLVQDPSSAGDDEPLVAEAESEPDADDADATDEDEEEGVYTTTLVEEIDSLDEDGDDKKKKGFFSRFLG
ncbi:nucleotide-binding protein [Haloferax larsenii]|uniref:Septum site-determining protein MinD n=1 Tax=Haloferax larsenii TaxID=302484 RepID=A0A1H7KPH2_HALLR|nr:AAA family ATPase [Haloferax larsenii]SEK88628.1 septum site-determining protein MinD [Haloferax larsenii]